MAKITLTKDELRSIPVSKLVVKKSDQWGEYQVRVYRGEHLDKDATYYTDSREDAKNTMAVMKREYGLAGLAGRRRSHSRRSRKHHFGALTPDQTANLMIGAGAVIGLGTLAYYFMREPAKPVTPAAPALVDTYTQMKASMAPAQFAQYQATMKQTQAALTTPLMQAKKDFVPAQATYTRSLYE